MPMDPKIKADWLTGLRSGEYKQAHGGLQVERGDGEMSYCCLGVLCKVAGLTIGTEDFNTVIDADGKSHGYLPISDLIGDSMLSELYYRNDGCQTYHRHTFAEIADVIEERL